MSERTLCRVVPKSRLFLSLVLCLFLGEGAVRLIGRADVDGNLTLRGYRIPPHRFPGTRLAALLDHWLQTNEVGPPGSRQELSDERYENLKALGYLGDG